MTKEKIAVVLLNLGGPDSLDAVEPFLYNLFSDKDIFEFPFAQKFFAKIISKLRAGKSRELYEKIGGKSPIKEITEKQRRALETALRNSGLNVNVFCAMRYWHPFTKETAKQIASQNFGKIVLLSLYPHYSLVTIGSSLNEWRRNFKKGKNSEIVIKSYHNDVKYLQAVNFRIDEALIKFNNPENVYFLFSAHSVPQKLIDKGDPYQDQINESVELIMKMRKEKNRNFSIAYQSKVGPIKWLEPTTESSIQNLGREGIKELLVIPISFVSEHIETLFELNIEARETAMKSGIKNFVVTEGLNDLPQFIEALKILTLQALEKGINENER